MKKIILLMFLPIMFSIAQDAKGIRYGESFISNEVKVIVDSLGTTQINKSDSTKSYVFSSSDMTTGFNLYGDATVTADDTVSFPTANDQIMCLYATSTLGKTFKGSVILSGSGTVYIYITDNVFNNDVYSSEITLSNTPTEYSVSTTFNVEDRVQVRFFLARISGATATAVTATGWKIQDRTDPIYATEYDIELINSELSPIISLPDTASITTGYVPKKQSDGTVLWEADGGGDSTVINNLIGTYLDTVASDTSIHTLDTIDKVVSNSMISNYEVKRVTTADEFLIFWTDDAIVIDSIQCESDDSVTIQIDLSHTATNVFTTAELINGITTLSTFAEANVTDKATLQFTQVGNNLGYLRLRIYWSFL